MDINNLREPGKLLVLEIGGNMKPQAQEVPEYSDGKAKIVMLDIDPEQKPDILADAGNLPPELAGQFDGVFASHVLEHFSYWQTARVLKGWSDLLVPGGQLHILVPSWEWSARQVLSDSPSPAIFGHTFAGQTNPWDVHLCMFTMRYLRALFDRIGLKTVAARTGLYHLVAGDGRIYPAEQHYICGVKGDIPITKD